MLVREITASFLDCHFDGLSKLTLNCCGNVNFMGSTRLIAVAVLSLCLSLVNFN